MAMDGLPEGVPPSGRVPGQLLEAAPILKRRWRRYREENGNSRSILGVSTPRARYRRRGHQEGPQGSQEGARRGLGWGRARDPSGIPMVAPFPPLVIPEAFGTLIFYIIFPEFIGHF